MSFYTYPDCREIGSITYKGKIHWFGDSVIYTTVSDQSIPGSPYDDNSYHFIERYDLKTNQKSVLYNFSPTTDISVFDIVDDTMIVSVKSVADIADWENSDSYAYSLEMVGVR